MGLRRPREGEQTGDDAVDAVHLGQQLVHEDGLLRALLEVGTEVLDRAADAGQGIADLVGRPGGQLPQRGQPLGPVETAHALASLAQEQGVVQGEAEEGQEVAEKVLALGRRDADPTQQEKTHEVVHGHDGMDHVDAEALQEVVLGICEVVSHLRRLEQVESGLVHNEPLHQPAVAAEAQVRERGFIAAAVTERREGLAPILSQEKSGAPGAEGGAEAGHLSLGQGLEIGYQAQGGRGAGPVLRRRAARWRPSAEPRHDGPHEGVAARRPGRGWLRRCGGWPRARSYPGPVRRSTTAASADVVPPEGEVGAEEAHAVGDDEDQQGGQGRVEAFAQARGAELEAGHLFWSNRLHGEPAPGPNLVLHYPDPGRPSP